MDSKLTKKSPATLTVNNKTLELPVYGGSVGPDVVDIRNPVAANIAALGGRALALLTR